MYFMPLNCILKTIKIVNFMFYILYYDWKIYLPSPTPSLFSFYHLNSYGARERWVLGQDDLRQAPAAAVQLWLAPPLKLPLCEQSSLSVFFCLHQQVSGTHPWNHRRGTEGRCQCSTVDDRSWSHPLTPLICVLWLCLCPTPDVPL